MNRRLRNGLIIAFLGIGMVAAGVLVLGQVVRQTLAPLPAPTPLPVITEKVVVTTHDIAAVTVLRDDDLRVLDMPVELVPRDAVHNVEQAVGKFVKQPLVAGELVLEHHLADPTNVSHDLAFVIGENQVLMAFYPNDLMTSLNILQPGDLVDLLVTMSLEAEVVEAVEEGVTPTPAPVVPGAEEEKATRTFTFDAMQRISISAIVYEVVTDQGASQESVGAPVIAGTPQPTPTPSVSQGRIRAYMLALSAQDALVLKHLIDTGANFTLVLRSPTSTELFDLTPVIPEYLVDRYELEVTR